MSALDRVDLDDILRYERPKWHADALCKEFPDLPWIPDRVSGHFI